MYSLLMKFILTFTKKLAKYWVRSILEIVQIIKLFLEKSFSLKTSIIFQNITVLTNK